MAGAGARQLALGIISLVAFIPISIVLGVNDQFLALLVTLAGHRRASTSHMRGSPRRATEPVGPDTPAEGVVAAADAALG